MSDTRQYVVIRNDLVTNKGKAASSAELAMMVSRASLMFLSNLVKYNSHRKVFCASSERERSWVVSFIIDNDTKDWVDGNLDGVLLDVDSLHALECVVEEAKAAGLVEGHDYFCVYVDASSGLLLDEGFDRCFVAVGFRPMDSCLLKSVVKLAGSCH